MKQNETNLGEKGETNYHCIYCDYKCCVKFSYERHLNRAKHINKSQMKQNETNETNKEKNEKNVCNCGLVYYSRTSLWRHKKSCNFENEEQNNERPNNSIMCKKAAEERIKKSQEKYKNYINNRHLNCKECAINFIERSSNLKFFK